MQRFIKLNQADINYLNVLFTDYLNSGNVNSHIKHAIKQFAYSSQNMQLFKLAESTANSSANIPIQEDINELMHIENKSKELPYSEKMIQLFDENGNPDIEILTD